ncbi:hypothetical protein C4Q27_09715 [Pseudomonas sp. SWI36]|nr:hypothetical protein C4Q27_09715 [Pseudomonas sp. SWI36]
MNTCVIPYFSACPCRSGLARECVRSDSSLVWLDASAGEPAPTGVLPSVGVFAIFRGVNGTIVHP